MSYVVSGQLHGRLCGEYSENEKFSRTEKADYYEIECQESAAMYSLFVLSLCFLFSHFM